MQTRNSRAAGAPVRFRFRRRARARLRAARKRAVFGRWAPFATLRSKIIALACGVSILSAAPVAAFCYVRTTQATFDTAIESIAGETRLIALELRGAFDQMENDAFVLSRTPPFQGLVRSTGGDDDVDPFDGSTTALWRARLETIFTSLLASRPAYTQVRYIGVADGGRELVRVGRTTSGVRATPPDELQARDGAPYFQASLLHDGDGAYVSDVAPSREVDDATFPPTPTLHVALPVRDAAGALFGLVVVDADYRALLSGRLRLMSPRHEVSVVSDRGHVSRYDPARDVFEFTFAGTADASGAAFREGLMIDARAVAYSTPLAPDASDPAPRYIVTTTMPKAELLAEAWTARRQAMLLALASIIVSVSATRWAADRFTRSIRDMAGDLRAAHEARSEITLPVDRADELGDVARAFADLTADLDAIEKAERLKSEFITTVNHELRTPITSILGSISLLRSAKFTTLPDRARSLVDMAHANGTRLVGIINDILDIEKIEAGKLEFSCASHSLHALLTAARDETLGYAATRHIGLTLELPSNDVQVHVDEGRFAQVMANLLSNAIKFSNTGDTVTISADTSDARVRVSVRDQGPGIPLEFQPRVFQKFSQASGAQTHKAAGTGLGLTITKSIVERFGGRLDFETSPGAGTTFYFDLQVREPARIAA